MADPAAAPEGAPIKEGDAPAAEAPAAVAEGTPVAPEQEPLMPKAATTVEIKEGGCCDKDAAMIRTKGGGLMDCCADCGTCVLAYFAPCVLYGKQAEYAGHGSCCGQACLFCCFAQCAAPCMIASVRGAIEEKLGGTNLGMCGHMCCATYCCPICALCQQQRAIDQAAKEAPPAGSPESAEMYR